MRDVIVDEQLCASQGTIVESRGGDVAEIANKAGPKQGYECGKVFIFAGAEDTVKAGSNQAVVVVP